MSKTTDLKLIQEEKEQQVRDLVENLIDNWDIDYLLEQLEILENNLYDK